MSSVVENRPVVARAHPNLALVKYWGQRDAALNLPATSSISVNLSVATTTTEVAFLSELTNDDVFLHGQPADAITFSRVGAHLDRVRDLAGITTFARVISENDFPTAAGMASSASAYAALSLAATHAAGLELTQRQLSVLARKGSGSASRSIPDGFCIWYASDCDESSYAESVAPCSHWDVRITSVSFGPHTKDISSLEGHCAALSSPYYASRIRMMPDIFERARYALMDRDLLTLGMLMEREAVAFHAIAMTSQVVDKPWLSGIYYWQPQTMALIHAVQTWRKQGLQVYFTLDAGPTVHLLYEARDEKSVTSRLEVVSRSIPLTWMTSEPGRGAWLVNETSGAEAPLDRSCVA